MCWQVFALLCMEPPVSLHPDDVRDEKVKLLRCVVPAREEDCVLGQYVAGEGDCMDVCGCVGL
jgi:glucose-6-phosphate 1-dehydrogenase